MASFLGNAYLVYNLKEYEQVKLTLDIRPAHNSQSFLRRAEPSIKDPLNEPLYFTYGFFYMILEM